MKSILNIFFALFLTANLALSQDTLYVYQGGAVLYKRAVTSVDSVSFTYIPVVGTLVDNDGHTYSYKKIGTQTWMTENLRTSKYRNGESISNPRVNADWAAATYGAWCNYNNDADTYDAKYGKLYNWYAVNDSRNIAPTGWHVATDAEWTTLQNYVSANLGNSVSVAKALAATTDWTSNSTAGAIGNNPSINNYSGFKGLPGGYRGNGDGTFYDLGGDGGTWWSSTVYDASYAYSKGLYYYADGVNSSGGPKANGYSVRCVKDF